MPKLENIKITDKKETYVEIAAILDRSGSMEGKEEDVIGGFNQFLADQKQVKGKAKLTTVLFDDKYEFLMEGVDLSDAKDIDSSSYYVRGMTALFDALGKTILSIKGRISAMKEEDRPHKVIVLVITDGMENSSKEFSGSDLKRLKEELDKEGWEFMFLGAGEEMLASARGIGFDASHVGMYTNSNAGTARAYMSMSSAMSRSRCCTGKSQGFVGIKTQLDEEDK